MSHFVPCDSCNRHVRADDGVCPFCASPVDPDRPVPGRPQRRLSRAALFAFGAAISAAGAAGCSETHDPNDGGDDADAGTSADAGFDAGAVAPPYGLPPDDGGGPSPLYGGAPED